MLNVRTLFHGLNGQNNFPSSHHGMARWSGLRSLGTGDKDTILQNVANTVALLICEGVTVGDSIVHDVGGDVNLVCLAIDTFYQGVEVSGIVYSIALQQQVITVFVVGGGIIAEVAIDTGIIRIGGSQIFREGMAEPQVVGNLMRYGHHNV